MKETLRHKEAFEFYYTSGANRSLRLTADVIGASLNSVAGWAKAFDWKERIEQRDLDNARRLQQASDETVTAIKAKYRKVIAAAIGTFVGGLKSGEVTASSVSDFERLVKLDLLLMGEETERQETRVTFEELIGYDQLSEDEQQRLLRRAARRFLMRDLPEGPDGLP